MKKFFRFLRQQISLVFIVRELYFMDRGFNAVLITEKEQAPVYMLNSGKRFHL